MGERDSFLSTNYTNFTDDFVKFVQFVDKKTEAHYDAFFGVIGRILIFR